MLKSKYYYHIKTNTITPVPVTHLLSIIYSMMINDNFKDLSKFTKIFLSLQYLSQSNINNNNHNKTI